MKRTVTNNQDSRVREFKTQCEETKVLWQQAEAIAKKAGVSISYAKGLRLNKGEGVNPTEIAPEEKKAIVKAVKAGFIKNSGIDSQTWLSETQKLQTINRESDVTELEFILDRAKYLLICDDKEGQKVWIEFFIEDYVLGDKCAKWVSEIRQTAESLKYLGVDLIEIRRLFSQYWLEPDLYSLAAHAVEKACGLKHNEMGTAAAYRMELLGKELPLAKPALFPNRAKGLDLSAKNLSAEHSTYVYDKEAKQMWYCGQKSNKKVSDMEIGRAR